LRLVFSDLIYQQIPNRPVEKLPESFGVQDGAYHSTSAFERHFRFKSADLEAKEASFQTFFCRSQNRESSIPYYFRLRIDGELVTDKEVTLTGRLHQPILLQLGKEFDPDYVKSFSLLDVDRSGVKDMVVLSDHVSNGLRLSVCLHQARSAQCKAIAPSAWMNPERTIQAQVLSPAKNQIELRFFGENDKKIGHVTMQLSEKGLRVKTVEPKSLTLEPKTQ